MQGRVIGCYLLVEVYVFGLLVSFFDNEQDFAKDSRLIFIKREGKIVAWAKEEPNEFWSWSESRGGHKNVLFSWPRLVTSWIAIIPGTGDTELFYEPPAPTTASFYRSSQPAFTLSTSHSVGFCWGSRRSHEFCFTFVNVEGHGIRTWRRLADFQWPSISYSPLSFLSHTYPQIIIYWYILIIRSFFFLPFSPPFIVHTLFIHLLLITHFVSDSSFFRLSVLFLMKISV